MWNVRFFHTLDTGKPWTGPQVGLHLRHPRSLTCGDHFHPAIRQVPNPSPQAKAVAIPGGKPPEADSLHHPGDQPASHDLSRH